jgi:prefoldin subunit 5
MKQAIKVLEKRIELLSKEWDKKDAEFENCEMVCDHEFLSNNLANIELEIIEIQKAIKLLNDNVG